MGSRPRAGQLGRTRQPHEDANSVTQPPPPTQVTLPSVNCLPQPPTPVMRIREISQAIGKRFVGRWHYSKSVPGGKNIFFGWFIDGELYAVAAYGIGVNPVQAVSLETLTGKPVTKQNLCELKRLCRIEPVKPTCPLTKF